MPAGALEPVIDGNVKSAERYSEISSSPFRAFDEATFDATSTVLLMYQIWDLLEVEMLEIGTGCGVVDLEAKMCDLSDDKRTRRKTGGTSVLLESVSGFPCKTTIEVNSSASDSRGSGMIASMFCVTPTSGVCPPSHFSRLGQSARRFSGRDHLSRKELFSLSFTLRS
jgi:hypothetical protein